MLPHYNCTLAGLLESFEVEVWVVKVSGQSRDIVFKNRRPKRNVNATIFASSRLLLTTLQLCWILCSDGECYYFVLNIDHRWAIIRLHQPFMLNIKTGPSGRNSPSPANSVASIFRSYHMALLILSLPRLATTTHGRKSQLQFTTLLLESFGLIRCGQKPLLKFKLKFYASAANILISDSWVD